MSAPQNLRLHADPSDTATPYVYGDFARMTREGGPYNNSAKNLPDPSYWTLGDLDHKCADNKKNVPVTEKQTTLVVKDGFGNEELYEIPAKMVSNEKFTGQLVRAYLIAGWTQQQILKTLEDPDNAGGSFWRWRKLKHEASAMKFFNKMMDETYVEDSDGRWLITPNPEPTHPEGDPDLRWIYPHLDVTNVSTGESVTFSEIEYYKGAVAGYLKRRAERRSKRAVRTDDVDVMNKYYNTLRELCYSTYSSTESDIKPVRAGEPTFTNSKGNVFTVDLDAVKKIWEHLGQHSGATLADMKAARLVPPGAYLNYARDFLEAEGFIHRVKVKTGKRGKPPEEHHRTDRTDDEFNAWVAERWGVDAIGRQGLRSVIPVINLLRKTDGALPLTTINEALDGDCASVIEFLLHEGMVEQYRQRGTGEPMDAYGIADKGYRAEKRYRWYVDTYGDEGQKYVTRMKETARRHEAEEWAKRQEAQRKLAARAPKPKPEPDNAPLTQADLDALLPEIEDENPLS